MAAVEPITYITKLMESCLVATPVTAGNEPILVEGRDGQVELISKTAGSNGKSVLRNIYRDPDSDTGWSQLDCEIPAGMQVLDIAAERTSDGQTIVFAAWRRKYKSGLDYWLLHDEHGKRRWSGPFRSSPPWHYSKVMAIDAANVDGSLYVATDVQEQIDENMFKVDHYTYDRYLFFGYIAGQKKRLETLHFPEKPILSYRHLYLQRWREERPGVGTLQSEYASDIKHASEWVEVKGQARLVVCDENRVRLLGVDGEKIERVCPDPREQHMQLVDTAVLESSEDWPIIFAVRAKVMNPEAGGLYCCTPSNNNANQYSWEWIDQGLVDEEGKSHSLSLRSIIACRDGEHNLHVFAITDDRRLCHMRQSSEGKWSSLVPLLPNVATVSAGVDANGQIDVFAARDGGHLTHLWLESQSGTWGRERMEIPLTETVPIKTYATEVTVRDLQGIPCVDEPVEISTSELDELTVNGHSYRAEPGRPVRCKTDSMGRLRIRKTAFAVATPTLHVAVPRLNAIRDIEPSKKIADKLSTVTPDQLGQSNLNVWGKATRSGTPLIEDPEIKKTISETVQDAMQLAQPTTPELRWHLKVKDGRPQRLHLSPQEANARMAELRAQAHGRLDLGWGDVVDFGELALGVVEDVFDEVTDFIVVGAKAIVNVVIDGINFIWEGIIKGISLALDFVATIIHAIGVAIDKLLDWLAFLFAWDDIIRTKDAIVGSLDVMLSQVAGAAEQAGGLVADELGELTKDARNQLRKALGQIPKKRMSDGAAEVQPSGPQQEATANNIMCDALAQHGGEAALLALPPMLTADPAGSIDDLLHKISELVDDPDIRKEFGRTLKNLTKRANSPDQLLRQMLNGLVRLLQNLLLAVLEKLPSVVGGLIELAGKVVASLRGLLFQWEVPIISDIYRWAYKLATGQDPGPVYIVDILALAAAIPATLLHKVLHNEAPFSTERSVQAFVEQYERRFDRGIPTRLGTFDASFQSMASEPTGDSNEETIWSLQNGAVAVSTIFACWSDALAFPKATAGTVSSLEEKMGWSDVIELAAFGAGVLVFVLDIPDGDEQQSEIPYVLCLIDLIGLAVDTGYIFNEKVLARHAGDSGVFASVTLSSFFPLYYFCMRGTVPVEGNVKWHQWFGRVLPWTQFGLLETCISNPYAKPIVLTGDVLSGLVDVVAD